MNTETIIRDWLVKHSYDGLCNRREKCGCDLDEFMPCGEWCGECEPAYECRRTMEEKCPDCGRDEAEGCGRWYCPRPAARVRNDKE